VLAQSWCVPECASVGGNHQQVAMTCGCALNPRTSNCCHLAVSCKITSATPHSGPVDDERISPQCGAVLRSSMWPWEPQGSQGDHNSHLGELLSRGNWATCFNLCLIISRYVRIDHSPHSPIWAIFEASAIPTELWSEKPEPSRSSTGPGEALPWDHRLPSSQAPGWKIPQLDVFFMIFCHLCMSHLVQRFLILLPEGIWNYQQNQGDGALF